MNTLYFKVWNPKELQFIPLTIVSSPKGICRILFGTKEKAKKDWFLKKHFPNFQLKDYISADSQIQKYFVSLEKVLYKYFKRGLGISFFESNLPLDLKGTSFQRAVWQKLAKIPFGKTFSYGQLAKSLGRSNAARALGSACGANPLPVVIPCHRVISSSGDLGGFSGGIRIKKELLKYERISH